MTEAVNIGYLFENSKTAAKMLPERFGPDGEGGVWAKPSYSLIIRATGEKQGLANLSVNGLFAIIPTNVNSCCHEQVSSIVLKSILCVVRKFMVDKG